MFAEDVHLSRTGTSSPMGKLTEELKIRMSFPTMEVLRRMAHEHNLPLAEFVRLKLDCEAFGADHVASVAAEHIRRVAGKGS